MLGLEEANLRERLGIVVERGGTGQLTFILLFADPWLTATT